MTAAPCDEDADLMILVSAECSRAARRRLPAGAPWRWFLAPALSLAGLAMIPWLAALGWFLPGTATVPHWNLAWVGLDGLEAVGLFTTGRLIRRGDRRYTVTATLTGTALLIDAWFDMLTAASRGDLLAAVLMACIAELPLSALCFLLALRVSRPARFAAGLRGDAVRLDGR
jgi:hypothetical protein